MPETKQDVNWANLVSLDLSTFDQPGGKEALAKQLKHAVHNVVSQPSHLNVFLTSCLHTLYFQGFFYIVNFGFSQEEVDEQFGIGKQVFDLPFEEKAKYAADHANGGYNGYTVRSSFSFLFFSFLLFSFLFFVNRSDDSLSTTGTPTSPLPK